MVDFTDPKIVDLSEYNRKSKPIDFVKMVLAGVRLAILRISHGRVADEHFIESYQNAKDIIPVGGYVYLDYYSHRDPTSTAYNKYTDEEWGRVQARTANNLYDEKTKIVFCDMEFSQYGEPIDDVRERIMVIERAFLEEMDRLNGKFNGMYHSLSRCSWFDPWFWNRPLWVAFYSKNATEEYVIKQVREQGWTGDILIWQFTDDGNGEASKYGVDSVNLDLNRWMKSDAEFDAFIGKDTNMPGNTLLNIEPLSQRDRRWYYVRLGTSDSTIGGYGCLITDATMLLNFLLGLNLTPADLNAWLIKNGGYHNYNLFVWSVLNKYDKRITFGARYNYAALDKVDAQLAKGLPVIVNVDLNPATPALDEHWVLVVGKVDGSYIINDPWYGLDMKFEQNYGNPSTGMRIVCTYEFSGEIVPPAPTPEPTPIEVGQKVKTLVGLNIRKGAGTNYGIWATAPKGTQLDVLEIKGDWVRVGWNQWALSKYNGKVYLG